ncbi:unnamed protein product [Parnassius mnemosyne]|uniref:Mitochondrial cardiolipin hydrolase n=1 Tax=Parnassius mnemosyne TaxID=213953 RepID=A0AAV1LX63_9NEOP
MSLNRFGGPFLIIISITFITQIMYSYYKKRKRHTPTTKREINEVIMFSYGASELKKSKYSRCIITHSMDRLLYYLNVPRQSLDICMYVMTNLDLNNVLMKLHFRGVKIRVIIDADMAYSSGSCTRKLEKQGIPIRWMKSSNLMHHKFCLVDTLAADEHVTPFVIMGSLNWTNQALNGNWEDVTVTSQRDIVQQYHAEFERLWVLFKPIVDLT